MYMVQWPPVQHDSYPHTCCRGMCGGPAHTRSATLCMWGAAWMCGVLVWRETCPHAWCSIERVGAHVRHIKGVCGLGPVACSCVALGHKVSSPPLVQPAWCEAPSHLDIETTLNKTNVWRVSTFNYLNSIYLYYFKSRPSPETFKLSKQQHKWSIVFWISLS